MKISEVMTTDVQTVTPDQSAREAAKFMLRAEAGSIPVTDGGRVIGMITDRDIAVRGVAEGRGPDTPVRDLMTDHIICARQDDNVDDVAQRMSQQQVMQIGQAAAGVVFGDMGIGAQRAVMGAFGMGAQVGVLLPFSRDHESEADMIGLELLVRACFDPREAPRLWERMAGLGGERQPDMLSTHPNPAARAEAFDRVMPRAIEVYEERCGPLT